MIHVDLETFEGLVQAALEALPEHLRAEISNLDIVVKPTPTAREYRLARRRPNQGAQLFGLYQGIPLTLRDSSYDKVLPDLITIYQAAHEDQCDSLEELAEEVARTVRHEVAHHFGIDDGRLRDLGAY